MAAPSLPPLSTLDPDKVWQSWQPSGTESWDLKWAGHLYRRASFGANLAELRGAVKQGHEATLQALLEPDAEKDRDFIETMDFTAKPMARTGNSLVLRSWWLYGMFFSPNPLREKMTLFWHNHFATSQAKVQSTVLMGRQNQLLRAHALGKFGTLLLEISKDPAMLIYLDSNSNVKGRANENYAREVMELFSLGVGHYTENDVREAARAFTGWHTDDEQFEFAARQHDDGAKTVLKQTGNWSGDDIVRILLQQDACARFVVRKLYRYFISESHDPPQKLLDPLCDRFRKSEYDVADLVKTILRSRHFFSDYAYRQRIKCPVEFAVGTVLAVTDRPVPVAPRTLSKKLEPMGQLLFAPPNVKGWPGGKAWLSTSTVLARHNFAQAVAAGTLKPHRPELEKYRDDDFQNQFAESQDTDSDAETVDAFGQPQTQGSGSGSAKPAVKPKRHEPPADPKLDVARIVKQESLTQPDKIADLLLEVFLQGGVSETARSKVIEYLSQDKDANLDLRARAAAHAVMTMPEYQLA